MSSISSAEVRLGVVRDEPRVLGVLLLTGYLTWWQERLTWVKLTYVCACRGQSARHFLIFFETSLLLDLEFTDSARLAGGGLPGTVFVSSRLWEYTHHDACFSCGAGDSYLSSGICVASTLLTEPSHSSLIKLLNAWCIIVANRPVPHRSLELIHLVGQRALHVLQSHLQN